MWKRLGLVSLLVLVACKGKEEAGVPPAGSATAADSAAAQAAASFAKAAAALAKAQAAASAAAVAGTSAQPAVSAVPAPSASAAAADFSAALSNELGRLGFSTATSSLVALGKDRGVLLSGLGRLAGHPAALSAIFNNDKVVSAFMKRQDMQDVCRDPEKMKPMLLYVLSSPAARSWVNDPESIKAFTGSKLGTQLQACPAFKTLAQQPRSLALLTRDNAAATGVVMSPNFRAELDRLKIRQVVMVGTFSKRAK
ncbi:MAG: hypothetical protein ABUL60_28645 [Myxococcales bacterium]